MNQNESSNNVSNLENDDFKKQYNLDKMNDLSLLIQKEEITYVENCIENYIQSLIDNDAECNFLYIFLCDDFSAINRDHAEYIYSIIKDNKSLKDIVLFLKSKGGNPESAYLISQLCNRFKKNKFITVIPYEAKSAATLLALGADEIHMGPMSELGPIDIQIKGFPLLSISSTLEKIASIVQKYPGSSQMFSDYLINKLDIGLIGHYDRITESAVQYAQILLAKKYDEDNTKNVREIANQFTNHYKAHSFFIDAEEAESILGNTIVQNNMVFMDVGLKILTLIKNIKFAYLLSGKKIDITLIGHKCKIISSNQNYNDTY